MKLAVACSQPRELIVFVILIFPAKVIALVAVSLDYPMDPPLFSVQLELTDGEMDSADAAVFRVSLSLFLNSTVVICELLILFL